MEDIINKELYHVPVLLGESIEALNILPHGCYVDLTFGGGGHSKEIVKSLDSGMLYSFDQDKDARNNIFKDDRFTFIAGNFRYLYRFMDYYGMAGKVDGLLADLGVSSHHFDEEERGFSFRSSEAVLDMRMNQSSGKSAKDVINEYTEENLADIFYLYGELRQSRAIAKAIVSERKNRQISTVGHFIGVIDKYISHKERKRQLGQAFQALRIEVNDELASLKEMLDSLDKVMKEGGRVVIITYHSLEDRIVKNFFKKKDLDSAHSQIYGTMQSDWLAVTKKPIEPTQKEVESNPRSRSAKMRVFEYRPKRNN